MIKNYKKLILLLTLTLIIFSCSKNDDENYTPIPNINVDLTKVPYPKLSEYNFFDGEIKNQIPLPSVLPYEPVSSLFSDYAHKKRFVWMPNGAKATFNEDDKALELPTGAVLIKTFYYENVQPNNTTQIIETRLMIKKQEGWIFANYVWNDEQTEAYYDLAGSFKSLSWKDENNNIKSVNYRIPNHVQCITCHKFTQVINNEEITTNIPIGIKPQNLNFSLNYSNQESKNQLLKWIEKGYLENNFSLPLENNTAINYNDESKPLELRVRSYLDINCAHCHLENRHCNYRPMRFGFSHTGQSNGDGKTNMGVCVNTEDMQDFDPSLNKIINAGDAHRSMMFFRIFTENETYRMPLHGRTLIHQEGVSLIEQWINSLEECH